MRKFKIDRDKAHCLAQELGIRVSFNSPDSGVIINHETKDFAEFFPELRALAYKDFNVVKEETLTIIAENIVIRHAETKKIIIDKALFNKDDIFNNAA